MPYYADVCLALSNKLYIYYILFTNGLARLGFFLLKSNGRDKTGHDEARRCFFFYNNTRWKGDARA